MGTVCYTVIDGEILSENRNGVIRDHVPDSLGSTIALLDNTQTITDTFEYWPYGEVRSRTGTTATPFQFVGTLGYYTDANGRAYVRARYLCMDTTRWLTENPIGFKGGDWNIYRYVGSAPTTFVDATGLIPCWICSMLGMTNPLGYCWSHCEGGINKPKPKPRFRPEPVGASCLAFICKPPGFIECRTPGAHPTWCSACKNACGVWCDATYGDGDSKYICVLCCLAKEYNCKGNGGKFVF